MHGPRKEPASLITRIKHLHLGRALKMVWQGAPRWTLASFFLAAVQGLLPLLTLYLLKLIVDAVTAGLSLPDRAAAFQKAAIYIGLAFLVALLGNLCRILSELARETQNQQIIDHVSDVIHEKSVMVDLEYYEDPRYHDTLHRAQLEAAYRPTRILHSLMQLGQQSITLLALAGLLVYFHWAVAVILFAATVPGLIMRLKHADQIYDWQRQRTQTERRSYYLHWMLTESGHAKEIRLLGLGALFRKWYRELRQQLFNERLKIATRRSFSELLTQASATVAVFGTLAFIAYRTILGSITLGDMVMYYQAFQRAQSSFQEILTSLSGLYEDNLFLADFSEFLSLEPKLAEPRQPLIFPRSMRDGIRFHQVSFQYPSGRGMALEDINLQVLPGQVLALVGENGSGKTTLIKLLCRLYDPTQGAISVDGIDLRRFESKALRRQVSVIFQDYVHYHLSARQNIWLGDITLDPQDDKVSAVARLTGADNIIRKLPRGYDTILGHWFETEGELSAGEWQRVALARAFLRDAQIIILDEPTSWLDARGEHEVFTSLRDMLNGRTAILISHRFSTVRLADFIYVLNKGKIIESGTHHELMHMGGEYAYLYGIQAGSYS